MWVVNAPHPVHRGGQCPPRNGFSDFRARGQFAGGGVTSLGHCRKFPLVSQRNPVDLALGHA